MSVELLKKEQLHDTLLNLKNVAIQYRNRINFFVVNTDSDENYGTINWFGIDQQRNYKRHFKMRMSKRTENSTTFKYKPAKKVDDQTGILEEATIKEFVENTLSQSTTNTGYLLEQDVPTDWNARPVKILTSKNYRSVVRDKSKNVLVNFCKGFSHVLYVLT